MRVLNREKMVVDGVMGWGYGIEADTYEDAKKMALAMLQTDIAREREEVLLALMNAPATPEEEYDWDDGKEEEDDEWDEEEAEEEETVPDQLAYLLELLGIG